MERPIEATIEAITKPQPKEKNHLRSRGPPAASQRTRAQDTRFPPLFAIQGLASTAQGEGKFARVTASAPPLAGQIRPPATGPTSPQA